VKGKAVRGEERSTKGKAVIFQIFHLYELWIVLKYSRVPKISQLIYR
jgi:hypothetical protein